MAQKGRFSLAGVDHSGAERFLDPARPHGGGITAVETHTELLWRAVSLVYAQRFRREQRYYDHCII